MEGLAFGREGRRSVGKWRGRCGRRLVVRTLEGDLFIEPEAKIGLSRHWEGNAIGLPLILHSVQCPLSSIEPSLSLHLSIPNPNQRTPSHILSLTSMFSCLN